MYVLFSGLLKKLLAHEDGSQVLMALNMDGTTLLGALKKLLLSKREVLQIGVAQILNFLLQKKAGNQYGAAILESDLAGWYYHSEVMVISFMPNLLVHLSNVHGGLL